MRVAVISDIHANLPALEAVLAQIDAERVDELWCLGDLVGYGADPDACTELVTARADVCLAGNHDLVVAGKLDIGTFSSSAAAAVRWTAEVVSQSTLEVLERLEPVGERAGVGMYHGSPRDPVWEYVMSSDQARAALRMQGHALALVGHSHVACWFRERGESLTADYGSDGSRLDLSGDRWIVNPGSVGQPRDGDSRAAYLLLDTDAKQASFKRVEYPIESAARSILDAGLPRQLADRLYLGQ